MGVVDFPFQGWLLFVKYKYRLDLSFLLVSYTMTYLPPLPYHSSQEVLLVVCPYPQQGLDAFQSYLLFIMYIIIICFCSLRLHFAYVVPSNQCTFSLGIPKLFKLWLFHHKLYKFSKSFGFIPILLSSGPQAWFKLLCPWVAGVQSAFLEKHQASLFDLWPSGEKSQVLRFGWEAI